VSGRVIIRRIILGLLATVGVALLVTIGLTTWIVNTQSGARWAFNRVSSVLDGALGARQIDGALAGPLTLSGLRYRDPEGAIDLSAERVRVDIDVMSLFRAVAHVQSLELAGLVVKLGPTKKAEAEPESQPFSLDPPLDVLIDRFELTNASVQRESEELARVDAASLIALWTHARGLEVRRLDVRSPDGNAHFRASVRGRDVYVGDGDGSFRWRVGERTFTGTLVANGTREHATAKIDLSSPVVLTLDLTAQQQKTLPWSLTLTVPSFDPREGLMPDSSLEQLEARLTGSGDLNTATLAGRMTINGEPLELERVHVLRASDGNVQLDAAINVGPRERVARIDLDVQGSSQRIELERLDVHQRAGQLAMTGAIDLQPAIAWQVQATARRFNPGEFAAEWPGSLNFNLSSRGQFIEMGPRLRGDDAAAANAALEAQVEIKQLNGRLRGREVGGHGQLALSSDKVLAGSLEVTSGHSRVQVRGQKGAALDAVATIDVPRLDDWLADAGGAVQGRIAATGKWPELAIKGHIDASALSFAGSRAEKLDLTFDVAQPQNPHGNVALAATRIATSGLEFETVKLRANGNGTAHTLELDGQGEPLTTHLRLRGSRKGDSGWNGTLDQLTLAIKDIANLALAQPVTIEIAERAARLSEACFTDRDIRLCAAGRTSADGALEATYSLAHVPLALANVVLARSAPLALTGEIDGKGDVRRDAQGRIAGSATITSSQGKVARLSADGSEAETLLQYADFILATRLDGDAGNGSVDARLDSTGRLQGRLAFSGLGAASTQLQGMVDVNLPSIGVVAAFAPQLANVRGKLDAHAQIAGTLDAPDVNGSVNVNDLATDIPALGLKLRNGRFSVTPRGTDQFVLDGGIASGDGSLRFTGTASAKGEASIKVNGQRFLAADIPGARVIVEPDLEFARTTTAMTLDGSVAIPTAAIDVQKLPRGGPSTQSSSPDVIVVDAKTQEETRAESIPLRASVRVTLGEAVTLVGFGLDAKVAGQLLVREAPGAPTTGSGEVRVSGTYKAYGQDLKIRQGQLLFAGTPLDNPRLSIVAVREVTPVVAGLRVEGSAQNPQLTVFSEPPMAQSNALAYLVTGKPLSEVGAGEGDAVQSAARSLGTAAGGLLAKNIGRRIGVDELGIKDDAAIGGAALTVGQYLSPRLYLSYGVGLFEPGEVVTLRYKLSESLSLEALNGPRDSRAGVEYRIEK
jgi:translocation and assembly module TamB